MSAKVLFGVLGPTATGKTALAMALAEGRGEIVSCDSAQVYIGLDVGTAKPSQVEQARVPHHLIDVVSPSIQWSAADYQAHADRAIADVEARGKIPILCGGTGLWQRALTDGIFAAPAIDPEIRSGVRAELEQKGPRAMHAELAKVDPIAAAKIQPGDPQRIGRALEVHRQTGIPISTYQAEHAFKEARYRLIAVRPEVEKAVVAERIEARTRAMYRAGLVDEVRARLAEGIPASAPGLSVIGYKEAVAVALGQLSEAEAIERTTIATRQYAKRQRNWWRLDSRLEAIDPATPVDRVWERLRARVAAL